MQRIIYNMAVLSLGFILFNCGNKEAKNGQTQSQTKETTDERIFVSKEQFQHGKMTLGSLEEKPFPIIVQTNGMIDVPPENRAVVSATMGGYIKTTPFLIGDKVRKGQALVTLENPEFVTIQQEYMEVNGQLKYLKSEFERQKTMVAENITSQKSFLQAESAYKATLARHNGLQKQLAMLNISSSHAEEGNISSVVSIYAPISGSITKVNVTRGMYVSPASAIMEIVDNDHIHLELSVFEKDIMKLKKGQKIEFKIPEASKEKYEAEVYLIGTAIEQNRTIKVHGHLKNESEANFLTGMFVEAGIVTSATSSKTLPETAVVAVEDTFLVLVLDVENNDGYYFNQLEVEIGNTYEGNTELIAFEKLSLVDKVLTNGAFRLIAED